MRSLLNNIWAEFESQTKKKYSTFSTMSRNLKFRLIDMMSRSELNCKQNRNSPLPQIENLVAGSLESCVAGMDQLYVILDGSDSILIDTRRTWNHFIDVSKDLVMRLNELNTTVSFIVPQQQQKKQRMQRYGDKFGLVLEIFKTLYLKEYQWNSSKTFK